MKSPPSPPPLYVLTTGQMRAVDQAATTRTGLPSLILMENAGRGVAEAILRRVPDAAAQPARVVIVCGAGNNGGDGFVAARHLSLAGARVRVLLASPRDKVRGDAAAMLRALDATAGVVIADLAEVVAAGEWALALAGSDVIVDALFGTGLRADIAGVAAVAITAMNAAPGLKVAIDIPSGLDADSGQPRGGCVRADVTVTMGARKLGLVIDPAAPVGEVEIVGLGVSVEPPPALGPYSFWIEGDGVRASLPRREGGAHKGTGGHLIVVAGSAGKTGAALLTARAALRAGAGLVTIASTAEGRAALDAKVVEAMTVAFCDGDDADAGGVSFDVVAALCQRPQVRAVALGPGIPLGPHMRALVARLAAEIAVPLVIDADGLNALGTDAARILAAAPAPRIVTPHPGEMGRLSGRTTAAVQLDRLGVARAFAAASGAVVVLKGARTLVVEPDGVAFINPTVEPALATAGSGDVLTGVLAALLAQGMPPAAASRAAVFLHGCAGTWAARSFGAPGVIAGDLPDAVASVRAEWTASAPADRSTPDMAPAADRSRALRPRRR